MITNFAFSSREVGVSFEDDGDTSSLKEVLSNAFPSEDANQLQRGTERRSDSHQGPFITRIQRISLALSWKIKA